MGNFYFEVQRRKLHFFCDYPEDSTPMKLKEDLNKYIGVPIDLQTLKLQISTDLDNPNWILLDDGKSFADQGCSSRLAKADCPAVIALIVKDEDDDILIDRMSTPPPMPEAMRTDSNPYKDIRQMSLLARPPGNHPQVAIGREAADLVFFEVQWHKEHFFVSIHKDSNVAEMKRMLKNVVDTRGASLDLHRPFVTSDRYTKLSDKTMLSAAGYLPDNSTPDRPAILVLTIGDEEPQRAANKQQGSEISAFSTI